jgi:hypothetical protein
MNIQQTLDLLKSTLATPNEALAKSITQATGLVAFDLQAPAKNLYPVLTPLRNRLPRVPGNGGLATNWKVVQAIVGSGYNSMPWVPEGQRSARMSYQTANKAATYVTIGEEDQVSYEAISASQGFEDVAAKMSMRLLQKMMLKEEDALLGGNQSLALGTPGTPTLSAAGVGATLPAATYSVIVVALTYEGFRNATLATGVATSQTITGADGQTFVLSGGSSNKSAAATQAVTLGQTLSCSVTPITGAVGYAWYTGTAGAEKLEKITTINSVTFTAPLAGTGQAATAVTADNSRNVNLAFDGFLTWGLNSANGGYVNTLATGTPGTGTFLTSSGRGSVNEIDTMLQSMWDNYKLSPTVIWVNSQEQKNITNKVLSNATGPLVRYDTKGDDGYELTASGVIANYFNPFALDGGKKIPIKIHPTLQPGTIIGHCEDLPAQYQSNEVPNVAEVHVRRDYYQIDWPLRTRQQEKGVYAEEVLAVYAPFAFGVINNIANG